MSSASQNNPDAKKVYFGLAYSSLLYQSCEGTTLKADFLASVITSDDCRPGQHLDYSFMKESCYGLNFIS